MADSGTKAKLRILVVDDDTDGADSMAMLLKMSGHEALAVYGGVDAINIGTTFEPNAVLLDISMPTLNGWEVARKMRSQAWGASILIIALTGLVDPAMSALCEKSGISDHFVKPVAYNDLLKTLERLSASI